jgi:hypothetical protein
MDIKEATAKILELERKGSKDDAKKLRLKGALRCIDSIKLLQPGLYQVASRRTSDLYQVTLHWCTCADNEFRNGQEIVCAHREAVSAFIKAQKALVALNQLEELQISL